MNSDQADILDLLAGHTDDSTIERLAFECLMTSLTDDRVASLMNVLGWRGDFDCFAIGGTPETSPASASLVARKALRDLGGEHVIVGTYGSFLLALVCQSGAATAEVTCTSIMPAFKDDESVYLSPVRSGVAGASHVLRETLFSLQAAPALASPSRPLRADELLPERALLGDDYAREELYQNVYQVLHGENPDDPTFVTVSTFLRNGSSLENTAKELNVHPNTVRYRLKRAAETTGWDATDPRDAYVLTTALAIGRMRDRWKSLLCFNIYLISGFIEIL